MNPDELKALVLNAVEDLKAFDIKFVDVQGRSSVTDVLLFASGIKGLPPSAKTISTPNGSMMRTRCSPGCFMTMLWIPTRT
jgi:hypothetical protein